MTVLFDHKIWLANTIRTILEHLVINIILEFDSHYFYCSRCRLYQEGDEDQRENRWDLEISLGELRSAGSTQVTPLSAREIFNEIVRQIPAVKDFTELVYESIPPKEPLRGNGYDCVRSAMNQKGKR